MGTQVSYSDFMLVFHGGMCCGIKTIKGFHGRPTSKVEALSKMNAKNNDSNGYDVSSSMPFFTDEAPEETYLERLDRYIAFCKKRRPQGIIEVTLVKGLHKDQVKYWEPILLDRGFKPTVSGVNSNSGGTIHVYHLVYDAYQEKASQKQQPLTEIINAAT